MSKQGYIKLHRKIQECLIWDDRPFNMASAWIDLLLLANHEDKTTIFDEKPVIVKRGQRITSVRILSERWGWGNEKTLKFLRMLESQNMITRESNSRRTLISIVNYDIYQCNDDADRTQTEHSQNADRTLAEHSSSTNKNDKNDNNDNKYIIYMQIVESFNQKCPTLSKVSKLTDKRKSHLKARLKEHSVEELERAFELTNQSDFLSGRSGAWKANFDWIIESENNLTKVLEGNYTNKQKGNSNGQRERTDGCERIGGYTVEELKSQGFTDEQIEYYRREEMSKM